PTLELIEDARDRFLVNLDRLGQLGRRHRVGREEQQGLYGPVQAVAGHHESPPAPLRVRWGLGYTSIRPNVSFCVQVASPRRYSSNRAKRVTAWVKRSSLPKASSKSSVLRLRSRSRTTPSLRWRVTVVRMWRVSGAGGIDSRSPSA